MPAIEEELKRIRCSIEIVAKKLEILESTIYRSGGVDHVLTIELTNLLRDLENIGRFRPAKKEKT